VGSDLKSGAGFDGGFFFLYVTQTDDEKSVEDVVLVEGWYFVKGSVTWMRTSIDEDLVLV